MIEIIPDIPFVWLGWTLLQFGWISTLSLTGTLLIWRLLDRFGGRYSYHIGLGSLLLLPLIVALLWVEHAGIMPPIGLADWSSAGESVQSGKAPLIPGLPTIEGISFGSYAQAIYYWTGLTWIVGSVLAGVYYLMTAIKVEYVCRRLPVLEDLSIKRKVERLKKQLDLRKHIELREVAKGQGPAVAGVIAPVLMIPRDMSDRYQQNELDALLLHELVHIKRQDYLFSLLQKFIESLFFFHPLVWWVSRRLDREREHLCDLTVIRYTKDAYQYAHTLVKLQRDTQQSAGYALSMAENSTVSRVRRLVEQKMKPEKLLTSPRFVITVSVGVIILSCTIWNAYHLHYLPV